MAVDMQRRRLTVGQAQAGSAPGGSDAGLDSVSIFSNIAEKAWSLTSVTDQERQSKKSFGKKDEEFLMKEAGATAQQLAGDDQKPVKDIFAGVAAWSCNKGLKPEAPNQDSFSMTAIQVGEGTKGRNFVFGVYDGHGPKGHDVSDMARKILVEMFLTDPNRDTNPKKAMEVQFEEVQKRLNAMKSVDTSTSGATCTLVYYQQESGAVTVGHIGDSRAVLYSRPSGGAWKSLDLTVDHKPNLPEEKKRIESRGGRVVFDGFYNHRVFAARGMYPGLNMSRAFGDDVAHAEAGLTAFPDIKEFNLSEYQDQEVLLVVCSDGVWEFIESEKALEICDIKGKDANAEDYWVKRTEALAKASWDRWMQDSDNEISDDITGVMVKLQ